MVESTITSKGQITLPKVIRERLGVGPGDKVTFRVGQDGEVRVEARTVDLRSLAGIVKSDVRGVTLEDMEAGIAEEVDYQFRRSVGEVP